MWCWSKKGQIFMRNLYRMCPKMFHVLSDEHKTDHSLVWVPLSLQVVEVQSKSAQPLSWGLIFRVWAAEGVPYLAEHTAYLISCGMVVYRNHWNRIKIVTVVFLKIEFFAFWGPLWMSFSSGDRYLKYRVWMKFFQPFRKYQDGHTYIHRLRSKIHFLFTATENV
jgi:hypothetical protein